MIFIDIEKVKTLIKNPFLVGNREQEKAEVAKKIELHKDIPSRDYKSQDPLTYATYETVL